MRQLKGSGRATHFDIFVACVVAPELEGSPVAPRDELARQHGLTEKEVSNRLVSAKRAYQRLLREEIAVYARSDDEIDGEIGELFQAIGH